VQFRLWSIKRLNAVVHVSGKCSRPPPKTSARHLGLHPQSDIRFFSSTSSTLTILWEIAKTTTKSLTNVFHMPENKKFQPKQKLFFIFTDTLTTSSFCFLFFSCRAVYVCRHSSMNNYRKSLVLISWETRTISALRKASRSSHSRRKAELRFWALVTRYRSVAWHPSGTFFAESASLKGFLVKWKRLRGNEDDRRGIPWPVYWNGTTWEPSILWKGYDRHNNDRNNDDM